MRNLNSSRRAADGQAKTTTTKKKKKKKTRSAGERIRRDEVIRLSILMPRPAPAMTTMLRINIPPVTRAILTSIAVLFILHTATRYKHYVIGESSSSFSAVPYLLAVPSKILFYPWTLVCATFVEQNIVTLLINGATMFYGGKYLERAWGSREFGKFILVLALASNLSMVLLYLTAAAIRGKPEIAMKGIGGGIAVQSSFLVAFKQLVPEHTVTILRGLVKIRVKHFPAIFLLLNFIGALFLGTDVAFHLSWLGLLISWTFLRFFKYQPDLSGTSTSGRGIKGDASDTFAFACFFPDAIQPPINFVAERIFAILVAVRICTPFSAEDVASGNEQVLARGEAGLPSLLNNNVRGTPRSGKREEAERRRALALKALDQRLQSASSNRAAQQAAASAAPSSQTLAPATPTTPVVPAGETMLGETNYTPDRS
ncbi:Rhomboid family [Trichophyton interdigitale]|nr:Rhomboid family [Trichophyton interdigitale]